MEKKKRKRSGETVLDRLKTTLLRAKRTLFLGRIACDPLNTIRTLIDDTDRVLIVTNQADAWRKHFILATVNSLLVSGQEWTHLVLDRPTTRIMNACRDVNYENVIVLADPILCTNMKDMYNFVGGESNVVKSDELPPLVTRKIIVKSDVEILTNTTEDKEFVDMGHLFNSDKYNLGILWRLFQWMPPRSQGVLSDAVQTCCICQSDGVLADSENCCHSFHWDCIVTWLHKAKTCPMCRAPLRINDLRNPKGPKSVRSGVGLLLEQGAFLVPRQYHPLEPIDVKMAVVLDQTTTSKAIYIVSNATTATTLTVYTRPHARK